MAYPHLASEQVVTAYSFGVFQTEAGIKNELRYKWELGKHSITLDGVEVFRKVGPMYLNEAISTYNNYVDELNERERTRAPVSLGGAIESGVKLQSTGSTIRKDFTRDKIHVQPPAAEVVVKNPDTRIVDKRNLSMLPTTSFKLRPIFARQS